MIFKNCKESTASLKKKKKNLKKWEALQQQKNPLAVHKEAR